MFDVHDSRSLFPALDRIDGGLPVAYFDGPGGTQVPRPVIEAMATTMELGVSNLGGGFSSSDLAESIVSAARAAVTDLINGTDPNGIVFGQNMTSLTFSISRALARTWRAGDRIAVTSLDHDANVTPWVMAADESGVEVDVVRFDSDTWRLLPEHLEAVLTDRTRLVAFTHASNALGTVPNVEAMVDAAHRVGALTYIDAVHFAPHGVIDVAASGTDFLAASAYKFFGPHTGFVYMRPELAEELESYKVRPAPSEGPGKWETGTQSFEALAGVTAAVDYMSSLGAGATRREGLVDGHRRVDAHLVPLIERFLADLPEGVCLFGLGAGTGRTPTFALRVEGEAPAATARRLIDRGLYVWHGHYYAVEPMRQLGLLDKGGAVRVGFVHTTTSGEVDRLLSALGSR